MGTIIPAVQIEEAFKGKKKQQERAKIVLHEIATIKSRMATDKVSLDNLVDEAVVDISLTGFRKIEYEGWTHTVQPGNNVTISKDRLTAALIKHGVKVELIPKIVADSTKSTPYTTISSKPIAAGNSPGEE